ncbi:MAG: RidA family protein [Ilumatobacteraceae bacterium]
MNVRGGGDRRRVFSGSPFEETVGFCRAVQVGDRIWLAGTAPIRPDGVVDEDVGEQARRCFEIISAALTELGSGLHDVVRVRQYLVDVGDFDAVGAVHGELFAGIRPVNTTVVVAGLLDPRWKVEIEVDAVASSA